MYEHIDKREPAGMAHPYKSPLSVQNRLYCLLIVRINQYDCFAKMLKSINDALVVCLQTVHRTICVDQSGFKEDSDGHISLLCGEKAVISRPGKWREIAFFGNPGDDGVSPCDTFAFYAIDHPEGLREVLEGKVPFEDVE